MTKFSHAGAMPTRLASPGAATTPVNQPFMAPVVSDTIAQLEYENQQMKVAYQGLRARVEKLSQADVRDSQGGFGFGVLGGLMASVGLAATIGVAASRKYFGQQDTESSGEIALIPQRAGPILMAARPKPKAKTKAKAKAKKAPARKAPARKSADGAALTELKATADELFPPLGYWDPLKLAEQDFWGQGNEATIGFLRHAEIKHGRVAMAGFIGYLVHENGIRWTFPLTLDGADYSAYEGLSAPAVWDAIPFAAKAQIILVIGLFEAYGESSDKLEAGGEAHYMRGGKPGFYPSFNLVGYPLSLYDPFGFNDERDEEWKAKRRNMEINNGRLAMIGLFSLLAEARVPGSAMPAFGIKPYDGNIMAPFSDGPMGVLPFF